MPKRIVKLGLVVGGLAALFGLVTYLRVLGQYRNEMPREPGGNRVRVQYGANRDVPEYVKRP